jgi:nitrous oxidase accessory protein NosD
MAMRGPFPLLLVFFVFLLPGKVLGAEPNPKRPKLDWVPPAPALPKPTGQVVRVSTVGELLAAADQVKAGGTISVADGTYLLPRLLEILTDRVTLRSESGQRDRVILDGGGGLGELVAVTSCQGVTIADLTIQNVRWNGFKINSDRGANRVTIRNCVIHNIWQRGVKGPAVPRENREKLRPTDCRIQFCLFYNDRPKQFTDDPTDTPGTFNGNYVGGIDVMYPRNWTISDNVFWGIQGRTREGRGAVFLWHEAEDCVVERNLIIDCDCGICLGNSFRPPQVAVHCNRCLVRNNFVTRCPETGILADHTRDCLIVHNTIQDPGSRLGRLIRLVHDNSGLGVYHNLLSGPSIKNESTSRMRLKGNVAGNFTGLFTNPVEGNLHLRSSTTAVPRKVARMERATEDIDRQQRPAMTIVGADDPPGLP